MRMHVGSFASRLQLAFVPCALAIALTCASLAAGAQSAPNAIGSNQDEGPARRVSLETGHAGPVNALTFSPNGQWLVSAGQDRTIKIWDVKRMQVVRTLIGHSDQVTALAFSPDGKLLASCSSDGTIRIWNAAGDWASSILVSTGVFMMSVVFSNDGRMVISGGYKGLIVGTDVQTGTERVRLTDQGDVLSLAVNPVNGTILASGTNANFSKGTGAHLWDLSTGKEIHKLAGSTGLVDKVAFSPDGNVLLARGLEDGCKAWDVRSGEELQRAKTTPRERKLIGFTPQGGLLTSQDGPVYLSKDWTGTEEEKTGAFKIGAVANFGDKLLATSEADGELHLLEISTGHELPPISPSRDVVLGIAISPDGRWLAAATMYDVHLWNLTNGAITVLTSPLDGGATSVTFSQDSKSLATWGFSKTFTVWDVASGKTRFFAASDEVLNCVAFRPGSDQLASGSDDRTIRIWNASTGKLLNTIRAYAGAVISLAFTSDGAHMVSYGWESGDSSPSFGAPRAGDRYALKIWDADTGQVLRSFVRPIDYIMDAPRPQLLVTPNGRFLVSPRFQDVWKQDVLTGRIVQKLRGDLESSIALSPDGSWLASTVGSNSLTIWNLDDGYPAQELEGHLGRVDSVAFASTRALLASAGRDGTIKIWDLATHTPLATLVSFRRGKDWVVITRDRWFSGTPAGEAQLVLIGGDNSSKELSRVQDGGALWAAISTVPAWSFRSVEHPPKVTLSLPFGFDEKTTHSRKMLLTIRVSGSAVARKPPEASRKTIKEVRLSRNGQLLRIWSGEIHLDREGRADLTENVTLEKGKNEFSAFATTNSGKRSVASAVTVTAESLNPEIVLQQGHGGQINDIRFSSDGTLIATAGRDRTIVLWDSTTGRQLRRLVGHEGPVLSLSFSTDGELLASGGNDHNIVLWRVATGQRIRTLTGHTESVLTVAFSPIGHILASGSQDFTVGLWDAISGREIRTLGGHEGPISCVAFSHDGQLLASASLDKTVRVWNVETGRTLWTLNGHSGQVQAVAFSPNKRILVSGEMNGTIRLWDLGTGKQLRSLERADSADASPDKQPFFLDALSFSPDGRWLVSADGFLLDPGLAMWLTAKDVTGTIKVFDASSLSQVREIKDSQGLAYKGMSFSPDGKRMAWADSDARIQLSNVLGTTKITKFSSQSSGLSSMAISPNGKRLATGGERIHLWNLEDGTSTRVIPSDGDVQSLAFSLDENNLVSTESERVFGASTRLKFWDLIAGNQKNVFQGGGGAGTNPHSLASSPDGKWLASTMNSDDGVRLWDATTRKRVRVLGKDGLQNIASFSGDGRLVVSASSGSPSILAIWDRDTGQQLHSIDTGQTNIQVALFAPGDRSIVAAGLKGIINFWDAATGAKKDIALNNYATVNSLAFSPSGDLLVSALMDGYIRIWNPETGELLRTLQGHEGPVYSVSFLVGRSAGQLLLVSEGGEGTIRFWDAHSGDLLATLLNFGSGTDWLVVTPDGLFDGTPSAWKQLDWRLSSQTFDVAPVEIFFSHFYRPGLLSEIISGDIPKASVNISSIDRRQPRISLISDVGRASGNKPASQAVVQIKVVEGPPDKTHAKGSGVRDLRLFRNGSLVKMWHGPTPLDRNGQAVLLAQPTIMAGENELTAYAFNDDNIKSEDAEMKVMGPESLARKGTGYVLAVGINEYANPAFNLNYAVADSDDFAQTVAGYQQSLARYADIRIIPITNAQATKGNILSALKRLAGTESGELRTDEPKPFEQIQATKPEDAVFIYYAGHGVAPEGAKRFYLIAHDYAGGTAGEAIAGAINDRELEAAIEKIDAGQIVLVIDACHSGKTLESDDLRQGPMNSQGLAQLAYEKGMYILAAAEGDEAAKELSQLGHGLLTYALVEEGLKQGKADDNPKDGQILLREWLDYATQRVPQLQFEGMQLLAAFGRDVPIVAGEQKRAVKDRTLQHPRVFYRREAQQQPLIIAKP